jgi:hypothetical protein
MPDAQSIQKPTALRWLWPLLLLAGGWLLSGCAGTAKGVDRSVYQRAAVAAGPVPAEAPVAINSPAALVVIRYPAMIHAEAESLYVSSFAVNAIGGDVPFTVFGKPQTERIAQSVIAKSGYYAMSLYRELRQRLPANSVLLSPHIILWDEERQLHSRPILASEQVPAVLTVDFSIYSFPDVSEMMDSPPVTFGDLATPLMVVRTSHWAQPAVNGLLVSSEPLMSAAWRQSQGLARQPFSRLLDGEAQPPAPSLDFIAFLSERDQPDAAVPVQSPGQRDSGRLAVEQYPLEKIQMDGDWMSRMEGDASVDPFARDFAAGASARVLALLETVDHDRATFFASQEALARFDPELGLVFFMKSDDESVRARLQLASALIEAEREFLAAQSESIYAGTYSGDFGIKMRKIIAAEYRMLEERRRLARKQNVTAAVAALALAGTVYGATVTTTASSALVASLTGVSLVGSVWAMNRSLDTRAESEQVNDYFIARMAPTFERQMSVQMEWLESKELITARGFAEFRNKTLTLYQSRVRSMTVADAQRCSFAHPDINASGVWYGACEDGLAVGRGYGLVEDASGVAVEFLGASQAGLAHGIGAMIMHRPGQAGPVFMEGNFVYGQPDGVLLVEEAGTGVRLREFQGGRDVGRGDPARLRQLSFASQPVVAGP